MNIGYTSTGSCLLVHQVVYSLERDAPLSCCLLTKGVEVILTRAEEMRIRIQALPFRPSGALRLSE
jgi:hypothetical protein